MDYKVYLLNLKDFRPIKDVKTKEDVVYWTAQLKKIAEDIYGKKCLQVEIIEQINYKSYSKTDTLRIKVGTTFEYIPSKKLHENIEQCRTSIKNLVTTFIADIEKLNRENNISK